MSIGVRKEYHIMISHPSPFLKLFFIFFFFSERWTSWWDVIIMETSWCPPKKEWRDTNWQSSNMENRKTQSPKEHHEPRKTIYKWCFFCCHLFLSENWVPQNLIFNVHHISPLNLSKININCIQLRGIIFRHAQTSCCWFCVPLKPVISPQKMLSCRSFVG